MEHSFDIEIATEYGMLEAVLLNHLYFWIKKNEANEKNRYDGHYWTYNSMKAFGELFPYASERKIRNALKHLEAEGLLITGNYNKSAYDRTMWYALTEKGFSILRFCKMESSKKSNQNVENVKPIPDNNTDVKTDDNTYIGETAATVKAVVDYLNSVCDVHYKPTTASTKSAINARLKEGYTLQDFYTVIDKKASEWLGTEFEKYLRPSTLFGTKFENYLNAQMHRARPRNKFLSLLNEGEYYEV